MRSCSAHPGLCLFPLGALAIHVLQSAMALVARDALGAVVVVDEHHARRVRVGFLGGHQGVAHDDHLVAHRDAASGGAVEADHAAAALACDDIGLETLAVVHVDNLYLLVLADARGIHQVLVDGDAAHVVKLGLDDGGAVDFALQHGREHGCWSFRRF